MLPKLFDAHTHLQFLAFDKDRAEVIKRTLEARVWMVNVGSQKDTSQKAVDLANQFEKGVYATVGLHPIHTDKNYHDPEETSGNGFNGRDEEFDYDFYKNLAIIPKVVAIGECGLDYFRLEPGDSKEKQKEAFIKQIDLASELKKPLMIHCREAFDDLISLLTTNHQRLNPIPGIIHFFTGTSDEAKKLLEMDFSFTFGGLITFNRGFDEIIKFLPLEKILLETDAPYVSPVPFRGKRNEPVYVAEVAKRLAEIKNIPYEKIAEQTVKNALEIFKISAE